MAIATARRADAAVDGVRSADPGRNRPLTRVLAAATCFYAVFILRTSWLVDGRRRFTLFDDAMISMTYARTFADGHGLVWYPGAPRVEGFTNPLWVAIMAGFHAVGLSGSGAALAVMVLGALLCLTAAVLAVAIARELTETTPVVDAAIGGMVAFCYPLVYWSLRGMEVGLVTTLALAAVWFALRLDGPSASSRAFAPTPRWLGVVFVLGVSTRLDFLVVAVATMAWLAVRTPRDRRVEVLAAPLVLLGVALAVQELLRHWYYGEWAPNTYTLKTAGVPLVNRLARGGWVSLATVVGCLLAAVLLVVVTARRRQLSRPAGTALLLVVSGALVAYSTSVGGDAWEWMAHPNRYLVPAAVLCLVAAAAAVSDLLRSDPVRASSLVRSISGVGALALVGPWLAVGILSASGVGVEARVDLDGTRVALLVVVLVVAAALVLRLLARSVRAAPRQRAVLVVIGVLALGANLVPYAQWVGDGGAYRSVDQRTADFGTLLGEVTGADARIAVVAAGATIYNSERAGVDLLGKSDAHIAALPSRGRFLPGHTKWDYRYSLVEEQPDIVTTLLHPTAEDLALLTGQGYVPVIAAHEGPDGEQGQPVLLFAREGSPNVDWNRLSPAPDDVVDEFFGGS
jgi:hypothetical protein